MSIAAKVQTLLSDPNTTLQDLTDFTSFMDPKTEDLFWIEVRKLQPTLCPDW
jgi:hypothetical protein